MNFTTKIPIPKSSHPIDYGSKIVSLGSCFAEHLAGKLQYFGFENVVNPYGILFHSAALEKAVGFALSDKVFEASDVVFQNERWHSFDAHSEMSRESQTGMLENLNAATKDFKAKLKEASHFVLTLGTAWAYRENKSGALVANCHKIPQKEFSKELLEIAQIQESLLGIISKIQQSNPHCRLIFTVSPVRHLKDGFVENQRSKSHLIAALHQVIEENKAVAEYFPSYEILMDELRDYRFYGNDLLHPSPMAVDYIWQRFTETYMEEESLALMKEVASVRQMKAHRAFHPDTAEYVRFQEKLQLKYNSLKNQIPGLDLG